MAQFSKFKLLFTLILNSNWGQFYKEISEFGYFKNWKKSEKLQKLQKFNICAGKLIKKPFMELHKAINKSMDKKPSPEWMDGWMGLKAVLMTGCSNQKK